MLFVCAPGRFSFFFFFCCFCCFFLSRRRSFICSTNFHSVCSTKSFLFILVVVDAFSRFSFHFIFSCVRRFVASVGHEPDVFVCSNPTSLSIFLPSFLCNCCLCVCFHSIWENRRFTFCSFPCWLPPPSPLSSTRRTTTASIFNLFSAHKWFISFNL